MGMVCGGTMKISFIKNILLFTFLCIKSSYSTEDLESSIVRGEYLAKLANCVSCHSTEGGKAFSGGLKMATPIGNLYSTNITPHIETGIGNYSLEDFSRSIRLGIRKDGERLYPAMPYPSYAKISPTDIEDLYNYFMFGVEPINEPNKSSEIPWFLSPRWPLMIWNTFFFNDEFYKDDINFNDEWNRGAYLIQGMGHCGACHTPRGIAWNEKGFNQESKYYLAGAFLDHWYASDLTQSNRSGLGRWSKNDIVKYLKDGRNKHSTAFGTMDEVIINSTQYANSSDLNSMATYILSLQPAYKQNSYQYDNTSAERLNNFKLDKTNGEKIYLKFCADCHLESGKGYPPYIPPLAGNPTSMDLDPSSLINITLNGSSRISISNKNIESYRMPGYRTILNDSDIADVVTYMRKAWGNNASSVSINNVISIKDYTSTAQDLMPVLRMK